MVHQDSKVQNPVSSHFFADYNKVWSSGRYLVIRLYLKMPEDFVRVILQNRFWVVHIIIIIIIINFLFFALKNIFQGRRWLGILNCKFLAPEFFIELVRDSQSILAVCDMEFLELMSWCLFNL